MSVRVAERKRKLKSAFVLDEAEVADIGNGRFDDIEDYTLKDSDGDGTPEKHLYQIGPVPNNILVDWSNPEIPQLLPSLAQESQRP